MDKTYTYADFCDIIDRLLGEGGCPWDRAQTHETLMPHLLEECYEVIDAVNKKEKDALCEELGDVLLQVVLNGKIAEKAGEFTLDDITTAVSDKMITRHPHIFGNVVVDGASQVLDNWDKIKRREKGHKSAAQTLKSIPAVLPALFRAVKVLKQAQKAESCRARHTLTPREAISSAHAALDRLASKIDDTAGQNSDFLSEIGSLLLNIVTISIKLEINPEFALTNGLEQFINRFEHEERTAKNESTYNTKEE